MIKLLNIIAGLFVLSSAFAYNISDYKTSLILMFAGFVFYIIADAIQCKRIRNKFEEKTKNWF